MSKFKNILPWIIVILFGFVCAYVAWDLKPPEFIKGDTEYKNVTLPVDSANFLSEARVGYIKGTDRELVKKYGKRIWDIKDSLRISDSTYWDTVTYIIPTLSASDTMLYTGFNLLNDDTLKAQFRVRVNTVALLKPVNLIDNTIIVDSLMITVPPEPEPTLIEIFVMVKWWLVALFTLGYITGN